VDNTSRSPHLGCCSCWLRVGVVFRSIQFGLRVATTDWKGMLFKGMSLISDHHGVHSPRPMLLVHAADAIPYLHASSTDFFPPRFSLWTLTRRSRSVTRANRRLKISAVRYELMKKEKKGKRGREREREREGKKLRETPTSHLARQTVSLEFLLCPNCERCGELL